MPRLESKPIAPPDRWLSLLACPACARALSVEVLETGHPIAETGILFCRSCSTWYPILNGVPRLLTPGPLRASDKAFITRWEHRITQSVIKKALKRPFPVSKATVAAAETQAQVQAVFEFKWKRQSNWGIQGNSAQFMENWILQKYGWKDLDAYRGTLRQRQCLLDAGCGLAREAMRMAQTNSDATVVGLELSACIDEARHHVLQKNISNLLLVQGDLMTPPLKRGRFDFIFSEGVLHHTRDTRVAVETMIRLLRPEGELAFYIYRKKAPLREFADDYVREQAQRVSLEEAWAMMEPLTQFGKSLTQQRITVDIPGDIPVLGIKKGQFDLQRWIYNAFFKCFWNDSMSFQENVLVNFDWYLPRYAWRHTEEEVRRWLSAAGMSLTHEFIEDAGITVRACRNKGREHK